ncbi:O-antigen ligase family protein [Rhizobium halophytocola]|uniref:O-antigen ligase-related domain-containing protein n=1 Tax=Rhizobium halophytocola TaxID=735519 RepID=A0ABS4DSR8_9HYPH|nr:O-antigen ligase family protein [Rhizobium halophytocola]MBP1848733.1 hypothetical protein [Rhizobium halophytocola]
MRTQTGLAAGPALHIPAERAIIGLFTVTVLFGLMAFGAARLEVQALLTICSAILGAVTVCLYGIPATSRPLAAAAFAIAGFLAALALLQTIDLSAIGVSNPAWDEADRLTAIGGSHLSVAPAETRSALLQIAYPFLIFVSGLALSRTDADAERLLRGIVIGAGGLAVVTLIGFLVYPDRLMLTDKVHYIGDFTASFVNRNSAATFLGVTALALATLAWRDARDGGLAQGMVPKRQHDRCRRRLVLGGLLALLCLTGLMLTRSRGGIAASAVAALALVPLLTGAWHLGRYRFSRATGRRMRLAGMTIAILATVLIMWSISGRVQLRAEIQGLGDQRFCIYPLEVRAFAAQLLAGYGFGTFAQAFPAFRDGACGIDGIFQRGHNVYLEGLMGFGLSFALAAGYGFYRLAATFFIGWRQRRSARHYAALGFAVLALVLVHSAVDFSVQLPGMAGYLAALLAPLCALSLMRNRRG